MASPGFTGGFWAGRAPPATPAWPPVAVLPPACRGDRLGTSHSGAAAFVSPRGKARPMAPQPEIAASRSEELLRKHQEFLWPCVTNYYAKPLVADRGSMQYVWDLEGRRYLDFFGGILTISVGHANPKVAARVEQQVGRLSHCSTLYP